MAFKTEIVEVATTSTKIYEKPEKANVYSVQIYNIGANEITLFVDGPAVLNDGIALPGNNNTPLTLPIDSGQTIYGIAATAATKVCVCVQYTRS